MKGYGHAHVLMVCALLLAAGLDARLVLIPFLLLEAGAVWLHVGYERERWHGLQR